MCPMEHTQIHLPEFELHECKSSLKKSVKGRACKTALVLSPSFFSLYPDSTAYIKLELWVLTRLYCFILLHEFFSVYTYA